MRVRYSKALHEKLRIVTERGGTKDMCKVGKNEQNERRHSEITIFD